MKRICFFIAVLCLFALGFTSCSKDVEKCWKVEISVNFELMGTSVTNYIWTTENELDYFIEEFKKEYEEYPDVEIKIKKSATKIKSEEACDDKNEPMLDY